MPLFEKAQDILLNDMPAIFLCNNYYMYFVSKKIKGLLAGIIADPSQRFNQVENWYIYTKRKWKH